MQFFTYLQLQLDRIRGKPPTHATGSKKPSLSQLDSTIKKKK